MSPPAVASSVVAAVFEGAPGPAKPDKPATKPTRLFAHTATLVDARQMTKADNQAVVSPRTGNLLAEDETTPIGGALSKPGAAAKPGKSQDRRTQGLEAWMQAAGWNTSACSSPSQLGTRQIIEGPTNLKATTGGGPSAGIAGSTTHADAGGTVRGPITPPVGVEGTMSPKGKNVPSGQQATGGNGKAAETVSPEVVTGGKGHVVDLKEGDAKAPVQSNAQPNAQQVMGTLDGLVSGIDRSPQPNRGRRGVEKSKPLTETSRSLQQSSRDVRSQGRASPATLGDSGQPRQVTGETSMPAGGKVTALSQLGDNPVTQFEPAILGTDRSAVTSHGVSDRTSVAGSFDDGHVANGGAQSIGEQIHDSVRASLARGDQQVVIRLHPPELGSVVVRFEQQNEQIDGVLEVSRSETRNEVEQALPQVLQSLQELGIQVRKLEVTVSDQAQGDPLRQQLQQDAWAQQQDSDRSPSQAQRSSFEFGVPSTESAASIVVPPGRIDMLV